MEGTIKTILLQPFSFIDVTAHVSVTQKRNYSVRLIVLLSIPKPSDVILCHSGVVSAATARFVLSTRGSIIFNKCALWKQIVFSML